MPVVETDRARLAWFVDAAVELLDDKELRMTPMTQMDWEGVKKEDRQLSDRILWQLEDHDPEAVAKMFNVKLSFVQSLQRVRDRG